MKVSFNLTGWADGFFERKIEFPLQIAMYEEIGDCDFYFQVDSQSLKEGGFVYNPHYVKVIASRFHSSGYGEGLHTLGVSIYEFCFVVKAYTKADIYLGVKKTLKEKEFFCEQIEMLANPNELKEGE